MYLLRSKDANKEEKDDYRKAVLSAVRWTTQFFLVMRFMVLTLIQFSLLVNLFGRSNTNYPSLSLGGQLLRF